MLHLERLFGTFPAENCITNAYSDFGSDNCRISIRYSSHGLLSMKNIVKIFDSEEI